LREAKRSKDSKGMANSFPPRDRLMFAPGGEDEIKGLVVSIETPKSTLQLLLGLVSPKTPRKLNESISKSPGG